MNAISVNFMKVVLLIILGIAFASISGCIDTDKKKDEEVVIGNGGTDPVFYGDTGGIPADGRTTYDILSLTSGIGYDTSNEKIFDVTILGNRIYPNGPDGYDYVEIIGQNGGNSYDITLAPAQYLDEINLTLLPTEKAKIRACAIQTENGEILVARLIEKNGQQYWLRDNWGVPLWEGKVYEKVRVMAPTYTSTPAPREEISEWEGDLLKEKWHERGEMMKRKWAERDQ